jgi:hypothetical protein
MLKQTALKFLFPAALIVFLLYGTHSGLPTGPTILHAAPPPSDGVVVYQFHRRFRCDACYKLEAAINEALKTHFQEDIEAGKLIYRILDLDAEGSNAYEKKYDFFYNTVIVVDIENGHETRFKNLEEVWGMVDDKDAVIDFIKTHITEYL